MQTEILSLIVLQMPSATGKVKINLSGIKRFITSLKKTLSDSQIN
jgi:hypothetical protein